jgi:hypothetical protein
LGIFFVFFRRRQVQPSSTYEENLESEAFSPQR